MSKEQILHDIAVSLVSIRLSSGNSLCFDDKKVEEILDAYYITVSQLRDADKKRS